MNLMDILSTYWIWIVSLGLVVPAFLLLTRTRATANRRSCARAAGHAIETGRERKRFPPSGRGGTSSDVLKDGASASPCSRGCCQAALDQGGPDED